MIDTEADKTCTRWETAISWNQDGLPGDDGDDGTTVLNGTTVPADTLGALGDFYLNTTSSTLFGPKTADGWGTGTSLEGDTGASGIDGNTILNGAVAPDETVGTEGDFYLDTTASTIYGPKTVKGVVVRTTHHWDRSKNVAVRPGSPGAGHRRSLYAFRPSFFRALQSRRGLERACSRRSLSPHAPDRVAVSYLRRTASHRRHQRDDETRFIGWQTPDD